MISEVVEAVLLNNGLCLTNILLKEVASEKDVIILLEYPCMLPCGLGTLLTVSEVKVNPSEGLSSLLNICNGIPWQKTV